MSTKIVQVTSVHPRNDNRIFEKYCKSFSKIGSVLLLVADGQADEVSSKIEVQSVTAKKSGRVINSIRMAVKVFFTKGDVFHFHDPELLPLAVLCTFKKKSISIFDMHEDILVTIPRRFAFGCLVRLILKILLKIINKRGILVLAEASYLTRMKSLNIDLPSSHVVRNLPKIELAAGPNLLGDEYSGSLNLVYVGSITSSRGLNEMIAFRAEMEARRRQSVYLHLVGPVPGEDPNSMLVKEGEVDKVICYGRRSISEAMGIARSCDLALCMLHPDPNYLESEPTKLYEYRLIGLPVVLSDFPLYRKLAERVGSCVMVNPLDPIGAALSAENFLASGNLNERFSLDENWDGEFDQFARLIELI